MDPFDEFQFKPLTDGLGFHKKSATLKEHVKSAGLVDEHLQELPTAIPRFSEDLVPKKPMSFNDVISSLEKAPPPKTQMKPSVGGKSFLEFSEPLPRTREPMKAMEVELPRAPTPPVQSPFPSQDLFRQPMPGFQKTKSSKEKASTGARRGAADSPQGRLVQANTSFSSALLDFVVVLAISLIFLAAMLSITKTDLSFVMRTMQSDRWAGLSGLAMFIAVMQMYVIVARTFYGRTLGEWTFDVQLGREEDQQDAYYPLRVISRSLVTTVTGLVIMPLFSLILRQDLVGNIVGVHLYQQR
jgi:hypothetical protein